MSTQVFVLELPIKDSDDVVRFLNRKFDFALSLYNATLHTALGRLERMRNSREWREAILLPKGKERSRKLAEIRFSFGLTEFSLGKVTNDHRNGAKRFVRKTDPGAKRLKNECILGVEVAETIGSRVWRSVERYLFGKGFQSLPATNVASYATDTPPMGYCDNSSLSRISSYFP